MQAGDSPMAGGLPEEHSTTQTMTIEQLEKTAKAMLALTKSARKNEIDGFTIRQFSCNSGGSPENRVGVNEISRTDTFRYPTQNAGDAYSGTVEVVCKPAGFADNDGNEVFTTPEGVVFIYRYWGGSPSSFDGGALDHPNFS